MDMDIICLDGTVLLVEMRKKKKVSGYVGKVQIY